MRSRELSSEKDYRYWFDPFWVRAEPYRVWLNPGGTAEVILHVRNFGHKKQRHHIEVHTPPGLTVEPSVLDGSIGAQSQSRVANSRNVGA